MRLLALTLTLLAPLVVGCSSKSPPTVPNPFNTADRVPPPALRVDNVGAPAYYQPGATLQPGAASTFAPGQTTPSGYPAAPAAGSYPSAPAPSGYAPGPTPAPGSATPYYGASRSAPSPSQVAGGDTIAVPTDSGSLRFAGAAESALARQQSSPIDRVGPAASMLASNAPLNTPTRRPATANAWIAGSAPVRASRPEASPRVRMPSDEFTREPVSLAALDRGVRIAPLEPAPTGARPGEPAPLRVATPGSTTGWR